MAEQEVPYDAIVRTEIAIEMSSRIRLRWPASP